MNFVFMLQCLHRQPMETNAVQQQYSSLYQSPGINRIEKIHYLHDNSMPHFSLYYFNLYLSVSDLYWQELLQNVCKCQSSGYLCTFCKGSGIQRDSEDTCVAFAYHPVVGRARGVHLHFSKSLGLDYWKKSKSKWKLRGLTELINLMWKLSKRTICHTWMSKQIEYY